MLKKGWYLTKGNYKTFIYEDYDAHSHTIASVEGVGLIAYSVDGTLAYKSKVPEYGDTLDLFLETRSDTIEDLLQRRSCK